MIDLRFTPTLALSAALLTIAAPGGAQRTSRIIGRDSLQRIVRDRVASERSRGLIVGVMTPDGATYFVAAGDERRGKPIDEQTIFEIGSITKAFTGILLAEMVSRGEVRLDQPVAELLPAGTSVPSRNGRSITLADLSTQTSGLPRLPDNMRPADQTNPYADYSVPQLYDFLRRHALRRDPGATYEYSNLGVGLLGHALALRAGKSYEDLVRERILAPLGMTATGITLSSERRAHLAQGHDGGGDAVPLWDLPTLAGAGALRSSLADMMRFLAANMRPPNDPLGKAIAESQKSRFRVNSALTMALNWHLPNFQGDTLVFHNGGTAGFRTMISFNPRTRVGAVLLGSSSHDNEDIVRHLLMGTPLVTPIIRKEIAIASDSLSAYQGRYEFSPQFALTVTREDGSLYAQATGQPKFRVFPEARDKFFLKVVDAQLEFIRDSLGMVTSVALVQGGRNIGKKSDPRVGLRAGWMNAQEAIKNLALVSHRDRPAGFVNPASMGDFGYANADFAISGDRLFLGGFNGVQIWDIANPANPTLRGRIVCPGGQGDVSVHRNLLFMSVEETRGRVDCGAQGVRDTASIERFRGVRVFDISNIDQPRQVAAVQTCRGSHTHTLVTDPRNAAHVYLYVAGTSGVRPASELAGCSGRPPAEDTTTAYFRIEVIRVPIAAPQEARVVNAPRIFADTTGNIAGLWRGGTHGPGTQSTATTDQCHDITAFTEIGLAAGACSGNGILLDIRDPANPKRVAEVSDPNFAYWHSATFNNDGTKVLFTDEWGGGVAAHCRATDRPEWGANAIFEREGRTLRLASYYKLPAAQSEAENCVAHNGSLIPVPGRDIMVQAWYQGGISVFDFTDANHPMEIAYFDRGPMDTTLALGGFWSAYWHNGYIYGTEIGRGLDVFMLAPSEFLSANEIAAASLVRNDVFNAQNQTRTVWPNTFVVARAYLDGLVRSDGLRRSWAAPIYQTLARAEGLRGAARRNSLAPLITQIVRDAPRSSDPKRVRALAEVVRGLATAP